MTQEDADAALARISKCTSLGELTDREPWSRPPGRRSSRASSSPRRGHPARVHPRDQHLVHLDHGAAAVTGRAERVIGMHFMNPVPVMKLVEVIRGHETSDEITDQVMRASRALGKEPVEAKDYPGFVSNRVLMPMINEAVFCLMEGVATREGIDTVMRLGRHTRCRSPQTSSALDVCLDILEVLHKGLGDDKYRPSRCCADGRGGPARPEDRAASTTTRPERALGARQDARGGFGRPSSQGSRWSTYIRGPTPLPHQPNDRHRPCHTQAASASSSARSQPIQDEQKFADDVLLPLATKHDREAHRR